MRFDLQGRHRLYDVESFKDVQMLLGVLLPSRPSREQKEYMRRHLFHQNGNFCR
jgi:hypothetical protein